MKLSQLITVNAIVFIALGIAFAVYSPLMLALFGAADLQGEESLLYWYAASFGRLFGAITFGFGFLVWAVRDATDEETPGEQTTASRLRRGILVSLILTNATALLVALTQQVSVWVSPAGWLLVVLFLVFLIGYGYFLARDQSRQL